MPVSFPPPPLGSITRRSNGAAHEDFPDAHVGTASIQGDDIRGYRNFDTINVERWGGELRGDIFRIPDIKLIGSTLECFDYVDAALGVITDKRTVSGVIASIVQVDDGSCDKSVDASTVS